MSLYVAYEVSEEELKILRRIKKLAKAAGRDASGYVRKVSEEDLLDNLSEVKYEPVLENLSERKILE